MVELVLRTRKPGTLVHIGDLNDNKPASRHLRKDMVEGTLQEYCDASVTQAERWRRACTKNVMAIITLGNHDVWPQRLIADKARMFAGTKSLDMARILKDLGWRVFGYQEIVRMGHFLLSHDFGRAGQHAHAQAINDVGHSAIHGHTHRLAKVYKTTLLGEARCGIACGSLADPYQFEYKNRAKAIAENQLGFVYGKLTKDGRFALDLIPIFPYQGQWQCFVYGALYSVPMSAKHKPWVAKVSLSDLGE